jgi:DNA-binding NarL/FixJ family response regulator
MAKQLHRSVKTVDAHRENIKRKLELPSATELTRYAVQWTLEQRGGGMDG